MSHRCPNAQCGRLLATPDNFVSGRLRCPQCGTEFYASGIKLADAIAEEPPLAPYADSINPYQAPTNVFADQAAFGFDPNRGMLECARAKQKAYGPAIFMQIYGWLVMLAGGGCAIGLVIMWSEYHEPDRSFMMTLCAIGAVGCLLAGGFTVWSGVCFKRLRSFGLVLSAIVVMFLLGLLICPVFALLGIWPLVVLLDAEVKSCFRRNTIGG